MAAGAIKSADMKQLIMETLLASAEVQAVVGDNVRGTHVDDADKATLLQDSAAIVFETLSGGSHYNRQITSSTIEVYGWSKKSQDEATRAYDAAFDALQAQRLALAGLTITALAREVQRPVEGHHAPDRSWFARGRWVINATEEQA